MEIAGRFIGWWLTLPAGAVLGLLLALHVSVAALMHALIVSHSTGGFFRRHCRATPIIMMPITVMFALLVGFLGAEIGQRNQRAERCIADEGRALETIHFLTRAAREHLADVREAALGYAALAVEEEYPEFGRLGERAAAARAVDELERTAAEYANSRDVSAVAAGGIMEAVLLLKKSRSERGLLVRENSEFEWMTVLALSVLAILAIGIGHTEDSGMRITSWCLFIPAMVTVLGLLALRENPYRPPLSVSIAPLEAARLHLSLP